MSISAKIIADSVSPAGKRITSMQIRYPRFIHAEAKTHRVIRIDDAEYELLQEISLMDDENLSRNASSSRAIPIERMIQDVLDDPAMPVAWGSNKPGMQAGDELSHWEVARDVWLDARDAAVARAKEMMNLGAHKQIVNRLLEPFGHISVIVTATEWENFFDLRCHAAADPTMRALADAMREAMVASSPEALPLTAWHLPYVDMDEHWTVKFDAERLSMISAARCARVSYLNHDGTDPDIEKDLKLANMLRDMKHMSPFEHQAQVMGHGVIERAMQGNLVGWKQFRKMIEVLQ